MSEGYVDLMHLLGVFLASPPTVSGRRLKGFRIAPSDPQDRRRPGR